jgi:hypothetical protein
MRIYKCNMKFILKSKIGTTDVRMTFKFDIREQVFGYTAQH